MKRGTSDHPKIDDLMDALDIPRYAAVGVIGTLWDWAGRYLLQGDVGKYSNKAIARKLDWRGSPDDLIQALVETKWLDECEECRLYIHGWDEHCEDYIHAHLARNGLYFANGVKPKLTKLSGPEKDHANQLLRENSAGRRRSALESAQDAPESAQRLPTKTRLDKTRQDKPRPARTGQAPTGPEPGPRPDNPRQATTVSAVRTQEEGAASSQARGQPSPRPKIRNINGDTCGLEINGKLERMPMMVAQELLEKIEVQEMAVEVGT